MGIVVHKNIPILKTKEQLRKNDILRGMCKHVSARVSLDKAVSNLRKGTK